MSLTNRALIRKEVAAAMATIATFQEFVAYAPLKLEGKSPVGYIHSGGSVTAFKTLNNNEAGHVFTITNFVNREGHGAEAAADLLDQLYMDVIQKVRDINGTGTNYEELAPAANTRSQPRGVKVDGVSYFMEEIQIIAVLYEA